MNLDESIVSGIRKRSVRAFEMFCDSYGGFIMAVVRYHLNGLPDMQEECIDDILLSVWTNMDKFDPKKNTLKNWVAAVGKYRCIDYKRRYINSIKTENIDDLSIPVSDVYDSLKEDVDSLLASLPERDRGLFYRRYILGESVSEIAKTEGCSTDSLYNRLSRGRKRLRTARRGINEK